MRLSDRYLQLLRATHESDEGLDAVYHNAGSRCNCR